jgi:polar amino acid transport system ATP-binding protein
MLSGLFSHSAAGAADFSHLEQASVEFRHVDKRYGDHQVLNDINLTITPGEVVAILGPSGSGKSTLIRLINQLETLSGGEILVDNKPTAKLSGSGLRQLRSRVGFVFQQFNLYAHLTASQNITLALEHVHGWKPQPLRSARWPCWRRSGCWKKPTISRQSFPVDSSSAWRLPAPWPLHRKSFCSMNPPPRWIRR